MNIAVKAVAMLHRVLQVIALPLLHVLPVTRLKQTGHREEALAGNVLLNLVLPVTAPLLHLAMTGILWKQTVNPETAIAENALKMKSKSLVIHNLIALSDKSVCEEVPQILIVRLADREANVNPTVTNLPVVMGAPVAGVPVLNTIGQHVRTI